MDGHICGLVVTALWSEEIISISLVIARNNTAYRQTDTGGAEACLYLKTASQPLCGQAT